MQTRDTSTELLVPPRRLGQLLATARVGHGYSLDEASTALGQDWSSLALLEIETGHRPVLDRDLASLAELYGIQTSTLIPERSRLVIDLNEGVLEVGQQSVHLEGEAVGRTEVLSRYLSMVYAMRDVAPGREVPLRLPDLEILSGALGAPRRQVEDELHALMQHQSENIGRRTNRLKGRLLIPVIGVVVAVTAVGTLLMISDSDASGSQMDDNPVVTVAEPASDASSGTAAEGSAEVPTEIGDAVVQEREADGTPGPVTPRS